MEENAAPSSDFMSAVTEYYDFAELSMDLSEAVSMLILFVVVFLIARFVLELLTPYKTSTELTEKDNAALAVSYSGYFLGITLIFIGAMLGPDEPLVENITGVATYSLLGVVLLNLSRIINDKLILHTFDNKKEIIEDQNIGTGAVQFGSYVASALIIAGSIHGEGGGIESAIAFFALGQVALIVFTRIYNLMTPFNIHDEIEKDNVAAGVAFGGTLIALGIMLMNAASGDFVSWGFNLFVFAEKCLIAFILLPIFRIVLDKLFISHADLNHEIAQDKNLGAGFLEMSNAVGFAVLIFFLII